MLPALSCFEGSPRPEKITKALMPTCLGGESLSAAWFMPLHQDRSTLRSAASFHSPGRPMHRTILLSGLYAIAITMLALPYGLSL